MAEDKTPSVNLDLDAYAAELETKPKRETFAVVYGGKRIEFRDPLDIPAVQLTEALADPAVFIQRMTVGEDQRDDLLRDKGLNGRLFQKIASAYSSYYDLGSLGE